MSNVLKNNLKYSIVTKHINFDPSKVGPKIIIVDGSLAFRLKGRLYTKKIGKT